MANFGYRDAVAVVQIVFFAIYLACGILLCTRHGWNRTSGFLILITFSILRLLGASFQLALMTYPTRSVYGGAIICEAIGISPLTVLNIGLLARLNRFLPLNKQLGKKIFGLISLASMIGIGIGIKGGINAAKSSSAGSPNTLVKVAVVIFVAIYLAALYIGASIFHVRDLIPHGEKRILVAFGVCAPLIAVRLVYALIADYGSNAQFHVFGGNTTIWLCMAVLEELAVVAIVVGVGLTLRVLPKATPENDEETK